MPERFEPDDPREWVRRAHSNLLQAKARIPDVCLEDLCFAAQQAAEKAIKAVLLHLGVEFPYTHNLARLASLLEERAEELPTSTGELDDLTPYAVLLRYPFAEDATEDQYHRAVATAGAVVRWAEQRIAATPR